MIIQIPCVLDKNGSKGEFISFDKAKVKELNIKVAHAVTSRYYKGIGANNDNMVLEIWTK